MPNHVKDRVRQRQKSLSIPMWTHKRILLSAARTVEECHDIRSARCYDAYQAGVARDRERMTNWQHHQWVKAGRPTAGDAMERFINMTKPSRSAVS